MSLDFRASASTAPLDVNDEFGNSPEMGIVAVFDARLSGPFQTAREFSDWLPQDGASIRDGFSFALEERSDRNNDNRRRRLHFHIIVSVLRQEVLSASRLILLETLRGLSKT